MQDVYCISERAEFIVFINFQIVKLKTQEILLVDVDIIVLALKTVLLAGILQKLQ